MIIPEKELILIDMDAVITNSYERFSERWKKQYSDRIYIPYKDRKHFLTVDDYPEEFKDEINAIYFTPGFYLSLKPIEGALEALEEIGSKREVRLCTSIPSTYDLYAKEKLEWVEEHLGMEWKKKVIITRDKTLIRGLMLIDDKPEIKNAEIATWEHIIFNCPYNQHIEDKRRVNWKENSEHYWKKVLIELL